MVVKEINRKKQLTWCLQKRGWTVNKNWKHIKFSDESQIVIGQNNQVYVWRTAHEAYRPECMTAECVPHRARIVERYEHDNNIHGMVWSAQSPDINVIENCWLRIKRTLQYRAGGITNSGQL